MRRTFDTGEFGWRRWRLDVIPGFIRVLAPRQPCKAQQQATSPATDHCLPDPECHLCTSTSLVFAEESGDTAQSIACLQTR
jgi:hypothetical protein